MGDEKKEDDADQTRCAPGVTMRRGHNPRKVLRRHAERGKQRWWYDYETIAKLTGYPVKTVMAKSRRKEFDMSDLRSVAMFILFDRKTLGSAGDIARFAKAYLEALPVGMGLAIEPDEETAPRRRRGRRPKSSR